MDCPGIALGQAPMLGTAINMTPEGDLPIA